ncbi:hypothetical protein, partial [Aeromonas allosaccharophila]|uniref:hypothetical protein n=1 Tax=Aeromonas allosaccharophila TaxID=656 RepID=UPI003D19CBE0
DTLYPPPVFTFRLFRLGDNYSDTGGTRAVAGEAGAGDYIGGALEGSNNNWAHILCGLKARFQCEYGMKLNPS